MEVFIRSIKRIILLLGPKIKNSHFPQLTLLFSFLPLLLGTTLFFPWKSTEDYSVQEITFKHVATPVSVFFDGQRQDFITEEATVESALRAKGIDLKEADLTFPSRKTVLDGQKTVVVIKRARPIIIIDNGQRLEKESAYDNVTEILNQFGIKLYEGDEIILENPLNNLSLVPKIIIERQNPVTLEVDGRKINLVTKADTVRDVLAENKINLGSRDLVEPGLDTFITRNLSIKVIRVSENTIAEEVEIPYETEFIYDANLPQGQEIIMQEGRPGRKLQLVNLVIQNGSIAEKIVIYEKIYFGPQKAIVKRGLRPIYSGFATWYGPGFVGRRTASGEPFNPEAFTAAHRTLPFGTLVRVTNTSTGLSCVVRINDRGPFSYHIIDLTRAAANAIGMESVAPVILEIL